MGLAIFFIEDIHNAILAANEANYGPTAIVEKGSDDTDLVAITRAYREGYMAALTTVALAFGLSPSVITGYQGDALEAQTKAVK